MASLHIHKIRPPHYWGQEWQIKFVLHLNVDTVAIQTRAGCIYVDLKIVYIHQHLLKKYIHVPALKHIVSVKTFVHTFLTILQIINQIQLLQ